MKRIWPTRSRVEALLGLASAAMLSITLAVPDWIERAFNLSPDGGDGSVEWAWSVGFALATVLFCADAGRVWWKSASSTIH